MSPKKFFTEEQQESIINAISLAELDTSGEIRVHVDSKCPGDVLEQAAYMFSKLKMDKTELRNGILFYLAVSDQKFAILGDKGINEKVPADFWDNIKDIMLENFKLNKFTEGMVIGIGMAGQKLKAYFPLEVNDSNELDNEVSFGE